MAHFVGLYHGVPDPDMDALEVLYVDANGYGRVGLWGFIDTSTGQRCTVKVVKGSGKATPAELKGSQVLAFDVSGLKEGDEIQAFSGSRPFTTVLPVKRRGSGTLEQQNAALLKSGDPLQVCYLDGAPVRVLPLTTGFGGFKHIQQMSSVNGLAVHITAGGGTLEGLKTTFETRKASTHWGIDRDGKIAQYVATSFMANAQGPGNENFLSVEMFGTASQDGQSCQEMTQSQLATLRKLYQWVYSNFSYPSWNLATVYTGRKAIGNVAAIYEAYAKAFLDKGCSSAGSGDITTCINSTGLSCHYWLDTYPKTCPGAGIMGQLPEVLGWQRVRVAGDAAFIR
jgi:hypothetical protein